MATWQNLVDLLAEIVDVPAGLIMRVDQDDIEVFVSSANDGNPYHKGDREHVWGSGLYCERVIKSGERLHVPDARRDENWKDNPDVRLNMVSYLGYPLVFPDGAPFGTICVLDNKGNAYSEKYTQLIERFREMVQGHLELLHMNRILGDDFEKLSDYVQEISTLRGILPICSHCKRIRDDKGYWEQLESYISAHSEAAFSHSICPDCLSRKYSEYAK